ncbi:MAG TPA: hypothetical protein VFH68_07375 [Polyangia bacterium]|jgi:hypothetical protein|nr:hypothetical protein [Polyangia bacterium]
MKDIAGLRVFFLLALTVAALGYGCGRTSLDEGLDPGIGGNGGAGGLAAGGQGGRAGGPGGQAGFGAPNTCGNTTCRAGSEVCCLRPRAGGQVTRVCVSANDPTACAGGLSTACLNSSQCGMGQVCCGSLLTQTTTCVPPGQCASGFGQAILCASNSACPASAPRCCPLLQDLLACTPGTGPC